MMDDMLVIGTKTTKITKNLNKNERKTKLVSNLTHETKKNKNKNMKHVK
jgi:hypothetical protein